MIASSRVTAFLDARVLYPALLRNILMHLALRDLNRARWSAKVHREWTDALMRDRPNISDVQLQRTRSLMDEHVGDALVTGYEGLIDTVTLPDADDRHVLAAAIHSECHLIVTANLRDFPAPTLGFYNVETRHPDVFVLGLFEEDPGEVLAALRELRADLRNPPKTAAELLDIMNRQDLSACAAALGSYADAL
jgi:hypothetical protein